MNIADEPTPIDMTLPACSMCAVVGPKVLRFYLIREARTSDGRHTTRGAGSLHLCERCWRAATKEAGLHSRSRARRRKAAA